MQDFVSNLRGVFKKNYSLKNLNWFKVGGVAEYFFSPEDIEDLIFFLKNKPKELPITILGAGSNSLISDKGVSGFVLKLNNFNKCYFLEDGKIFAEAGTLNITISKLAYKGYQKFVEEKKSQKISQIDEEAKQKGEGYQELNKAEKKHQEFSHKRNEPQEKSYFSQDNYVINTDTLMNESQETTYSPQRFSKTDSESQEIAYFPQGGFEFLSGIPGSIGGAIVMNAGSFDCEFCDICVSVQALNLKGELLELSKDDFGFAYRKNSIKEPLIFISTIMQGFDDTSDNIKKKLEAIKIKREETQPKKVLTGGSTFANPTQNNPKGYKAWELIDKVGLRGYKIGNAGFSEKHCNFIINYGEATSEDIEKLIIEAQTRVKKEFNIELHSEIKFIK